MRPVLFVIATIVITAIVLSVLTVAQTDDGNGEALPDAPYSSITVENTDPNIRWIENCQLVSYTEDEVEYGLCSMDETVSICDEPGDNSTEAACRDENVLTQYECVTDIKKIPKERIECTKKELIIKEKYNINLQEYGCKATSEGGTVTAICDSKYDGNGDGICTSGESCMKFVVDSNGVKKSEKNSMDVFTEKAYDYFVSRVQPEVLQ